MSSHRADSRTDGYCSHTEDFVKFFTSLVLYIIGTTLGKVRWEVPFQGRVSEFSETPEKLGPKLVTAGTLAPGEKQSGIVANLPKDYRRGPASNHARSHQ